MRAYRPLCFASILLTLPLGLLAQSHPTKIENGTLAGTVTDTTENVPITGAYVAVTSRMQSSKANARTDRLGHFVLSLPPGDYQLSIIAHGFVPAQARVSVASGKATRHDSRLRVDTEHLEESDGP